MNGLASRVAAPEPAPSVRAAPVPAPARELDAEPATPTTRDRVEAAFGTPAPTTRDRIVNRALAADAEALPAESAEVVDLTEERDRRRPGTVAEPAPAEGPLAPVIELEPKPLPDARAPPEPGLEEAEAPSPGDAVAGEESVRAPPEEAAAPVEEVVAEPAAPGPQDDPAFQAMAARVDANAARSTDHQPAHEAAANAQGASEPDVRKDVASQAAGDQIQEMGAKKPGEFDPVAFKAAVAKAVEGMAPPSSMEEAEEFESSGKGKAATATIHGLVKSGKASSERDIKVATEAPPDAEGKLPKPVETRVDDTPGPPLPDVQAESALPGLRPESETDLSDGPLAIQRKLAEAKVTEAQLAEGNEPEFNGALSATAEVREHAATAPGGYREQEQLILADGRAGAQQVAATQTAGMRGSRVGALDQVLKAKDDTTLADQAIRDDINGRIIGIHSQTQADVMKILGLLDGAVESTFTTGETAARKAFEADVARKMKEYKRKRYKGARGKLRWLRDKIRDLPSSVNKFYRDSRADYLRAMDRVIEAIATTVGIMLGLAHARILVGRAQVEAFVAGLPTATRKLGVDAAADLDHKFDDLAADVDAKRDEVVDTVARLYVNSTSQLDERIKELKEANKGLVSRAIDAVVGVLKTIYELGKLLLRVLLKAAAAIGDILAHPIRFLGNLVGAVKGGLERFVDRIGVHLEKAMLDLLFGELGGAGIRMPKQLDFSGILDLVLQVLGLTYSDIRERLVKRFGEESVARMEETVDVFQTILRHGLGGLWAWVADKLGDLEDLVIGKIKAYIVERVIRAGIGYIIALLNPAAAFIKACQGIYQIVMFIVERARQIAAFVESVLDSISAIAQGNVGAAVERIESALGDALSLAIAFLARLANLGALSEKMRSIITAIRKPVTRAVDLVVFGAAEVYRRTVGRALAFGREKVQAGKDLVKRRAAPEEPPAKQPVVVAKQVPPPETAPPEPVIDRKWIYEKADGKHTLRISSKFEVFRFSAPTLVVGAAAQAVQQQDLESKVAQTPVAYPTDGLGRADGPSGFVDGIKDNEGRSSMPAVHRLPGGVAAYEPGDVRGHLVGDRFYGKAVGGNLVPMHTTLNGSTFLSFETRLANAAKASRSAGRGALVSMAIKPDYPADDPASPGRKYRPDPVRADCRLYSLDDTGGVAETDFKGQFKNPSNAVETVNVNTADKTEILAVFSGQLSPDVHQLVDAIVAVRPKASVELFAEALAMILPADKLDRFEELFFSRRGRMVIG